MLPAGLTACPPPGATFRKLVRDGLLDDSTPFEVSAPSQAWSPLRDEPPSASSTAERRGLEWEWFPDTVAEARAPPGPRLTPLEGSVVAVHYLARLNGPSINESFPAQPSACRHQARTRLATALPEQSFAASAVVSRGRCSR